MLDVWGSVRPKLAWAEFAQPSDFDLRQLVQPKLAGSVARASEFDAGPELPRDPGGAFARPADSHLWRGLSELKRSESARDAADLEVRRSDEPTLAGGHPAQQSPESHHRRSVQRRLGGSPARTAELDFGLQLQPKLARGAASQYTAESHLWHDVQPNFTVRDSAKQLAEPQLRAELQPKPEGSALAKQPSKLDVWTKLQPKLP